MAGGADHLLLDTVRRRLRQPADWLVIALHLSRLAPPAPRPHHRRIARVLMEDTARRHEGSVFAPGNGDMVLLCRKGEERRTAAGLRVASPTSLPDVLARLLRADVPEPQDLVSLWPLESCGDVVLSYAMARVASAASFPSPDTEMRSQPGEVDAIATALDGSDVVDLLHRRTAVLIAEDGLRPLFRDIRFSRASLQGRVPQAAPTDFDPFLFRHLAEQLDRRMLGLVDHALGGRGGLDPSVAGAPRLHLNLTLASLRSDGFARLSEALLGRGLSLGVEISLMEACADPDRFEQARGALRRLGMAVVLDGVSRHALTFTRISALEPDLVKLPWTPRVADQERAHDHEAALIRDLGPDRIVLHHAENEAAMQWGLDRGIRRFQGRHVEWMLGALRLSACPAGTGCTLQQCIGRVAAADPAGRQGCRNPALLDAGAPPPHAVRIPAPSPRAMLVGA